MSENKYAFFVNINHCIGCRACEIACKQENELDDGIRWRQVREMDGKTNGHPTKYFMSMACNHCEDPICVRVCPTTAMTRREDGIVYVDESKCVGCRYCEWACPYSAPRFNANTGHMSKCTFCMHRIDEGEGPACAAACPTKALQWGPLEEIAAKEGVVDQFDKLPDADITQPAIRFVPPRLDRF